MKMDTNSDKLTGLAKSILIVGAGLLLSCATETVSIDPDAMMRNTGKGSSASEDTPIYSSDFIHEGKRYRLRLIVESTETGGDEKSNGFHIHTNAMGILWGYNKQTQNYDIPMGHCSNYKVYSVFLDGGKLRLRLAGGSEAKGQSGIDGYGLEITTTVTPATHHWSGYTSEEDELEALFDFDYKVLPQPPVGDPEPEVELFGSVSTARSWKIVKDPANPPGIRVVYASRHTE